MTAHATEPKCPYSGPCPGCPGIATPYDVQCADKRAHVLAALAPYRELALLGVADTLPAEPRFGYRTRAKLVAAPGEGLGLYARGGHTLVDLPHCGVLLPEVASLVAQLRTWVLAGLPVLALDVTSVGSARLVTFVVEGEGNQSAAARAWLAPKLHELPADVHVAVSVRERGPQLLGTRHLVLRGAAEVRARAFDHGPYHFATHGGFSQAHRHVAAAIYAEIRGRLGTLGGGGRLRILELYAGAGALSLALAADGHEVTAVESFAPAVMRITRAAAEQKLAVRAIAGDAAGSSAGLADAGERFDAILVNPPRRGLEPEVRAAVAALAAQLIAYVSCAPETLARDLASFARAGWSASSVLPCDMIPLSEHVESLVFLVPSAPSALSVLREHTDWAVIACADAAELGRAQRYFEHARCYAPAACGLALIIRARSTVHAARAKLTVLARGITHKRGRLGALAYRCEQRVGGHSLLHVEGAPDAFSSLFAQLARIGHPVIGDAASDRASARHFAMRYGLEQPFVQCTELHVLGDGADERVAMELVPELALVLHQLRADRVRGAGHGA